MASVKELLDNNPGKKIQQYDTELMRDYLCVPCEPYIDGDTIKHFNLVEMTEEQKKQRYSHNANAIISRRRYIMDNMAWRYQKAERQIRLGITPDDSIEELDTYMQALADITKQEGYPWHVEWPKMGNIF